MNAIEILGSLLGGHSGRGGAGSDILADILGGKQDHQYKHPSISKGHQNILDRSINKYFLRIHRLDSNPFGERWPELVDGLLNRITYGSCIRPRLLAIVKTTAGPPRN